MVCRKHFVSSTVCYLLATRSDKHVEINANFKRLGFVNIERGVSEDIENISVDLAY